MSLPWRTLGVAGAALVVSAWPAAQQALWLPTEGWAAQPWRLLTSHLVHHGSTHLLWDLGAFVVLGVALELLSPGRLLAVLGVGALCVGLAMGTLLPANGVFAGLSGIDAALFLALAAGLARGDGADRWLGWGMGVAFGAKVAWELASGGVLFAGSEGVVHAPVAHLVGAVAGLVVGLRGQGSGRSSIQAVRSLAGTVPSSPES